MKEIFKIATSVSTPLALAGLIAAILFYVILQMLKKRSSNQNPIFSTILKYLFVLALTSLILGFSGYLFAYSYLPSKNLTIRGIVFLDGKTRDGIKVEALEERLTTRTDPYGAFSLNFDDKIKLDYYSIKFSDRDIATGDTTLSIKNDSSFNHFYLRSNKLSTIIEVANPRNVNTPKVTSSGGVKKQEKIDVSTQQKIIVKSPDPPNIAFNSAPNFDSLYKIYSTNELKLSEYGKLAYEHEDIDYTVKFFERAHLVQSSKVWESNIPYLIAAYWKENKDQEAESAIKYMYTEAMTGPGYLNSNTTIGFLIQNFGYIKNTLPTKYQGRIDDIVDKLLEIKKQVP